MAAFQTLADLRRSQVGRQRTQLDSRPKKETGPVNKTLGQNVAAEHSPWLNPRLHRHPVCEKDAEHKSQKLYI